MSSILLIRHAETVMAGAFCGHSDPGLNAQGRQQAARLARLLSSEPIDTVYSSDLLRATSTAQAIAAAREIPLLERPGLREIYFGRWEGLRWEEIEALDPEYARDWIARHPDLPAPAGESFQAFEARILEEVSHLFQCSDRRIAVVTHAGAMRVVLRHLCGRSDAEAWKQTEQYCSVVRV